MTSVTNWLKGTGRGGLTLGLLLAGLVSWLGTRYAESGPFMTLAQTPLAESLTAEHNAIAVEPVRDISEMTAGQRAAAYAGFREHLTAFTRDQVRRHWTAGAGLVLGVGCWLVGGLRLMCAQRRRPALRPTAHPAPRPADTTMMMSLPA